MADHKFRPEIEVLSAADVPRRRYWDDADKIRIVEESFLGHCQVSATARRHGVSRSLLTIWRRQYRDGELGDETPPSFTPLAVSPILSNPHRPCSGQVPRLRGLLFESHLSSWRSAVRKRSRRRSGHVGTAGISRWSAFSPAFLERSRPSSACRSVKLLRAAREGFLAP